MLIKRPADIKSSEITPESTYLKRRDFIGAAAAGAALVGLPNAARAMTTNREDELTPLDDVTGYNNFYEFGVAKTDPAKNAYRLTTSPWKVKVEGEVNKPGEWDLDELLRGIAVEERVYRLRCVEAWSMVIPWQGFSLSEMFKKFEPTPSARYVEFTTLVRPEEMIGQRRGVLAWPYREGLRMDEAMHPLAIFGTGLYDQPMPKQNGAPLRLVVPWKYGFKSIKSIVGIRFTETQPENSWKRSAPQEYGFFANVNPEVDHPRWSQARERRIGDFFKRPTLMFNGYADEVGSLYAGMDLRRNY
jgi:sulfoxide reductase catalytic subunit YedY